VTVIRSPPPSRSLHSAYGVLAPALRGAPWSYRRPSRHPRPHRRLPRAVSAHQSPHKPPRTGARCHYWPWGRADAPDARRARGHCPQLWGRIEAARSGPRPREHRALPFATRTLWTEPLGLAEHGPPALLPQHHPPQSQPARPSCSSRPKRPAARPGLPTEGSLWDRLQGKGPAEFNARPLMQARREDDTPLPRPCPVAVPQ